MPPQRKWLSPWSTSVRLCMRRPRRRFLMSGKRCGNFIRGNRLPRSPLLLRAPAMRRQHRSRSNGLRTCSRWNPIPTRSRPCNRNRFKRIRPRARSACARRGPRWPKNPWCRSKPTVRKRRPAPAARKRQSDRRFRAGEKGGDAPFFYSCRGAWRFRRCSSKPREACSTRSRTCSKPCAPP